MKNYKIVKLEDMLGHVYSGRADVAMIDELIAWLQLRRESVTTQQSGRTGGYASLICRHGIMGCIVCEQEKETTRR